MAVVHTQEASAIAATVDIGSRLRRAREARGLSLRDIANTTKISMAALNAIEHDDFARLPGGLFSRGYVRAFAAEVGLNADELAREYRAAFESEWPSVPYRRPELDWDGRDGVVRRAATVLVAGGGLLIGALLLSQPDRPAEDPPADERAPNAVGVGSSKATTPTDRSGDIPGVALASTPGASALRLEIRLSGLCWISAVADGERVIYRLMQPGEQTLIEARRSITLRVGDAGAVAYSINGKVGRPLGLSGDAVTVRMTGDNYQVLYEETPGTPSRSAATRVGLD